MSKGSDILMFNCRNGKYCMPEGTVKDLNYLTTVGLEPNVSTSPQYGDGGIIYEFVADSGSKFTLGMTAPCQEYEIDTYRAMVIDGGVADISQTQNIPHNIYFEYESADKGQPSKIVKVWALNVTTQKAAITFNQTNANVNASEISHTGIVMGENLKSLDGLADYVDVTTGKTVTVQYIRCKPNDVGYATFGDKPPVPKMKAAAPEVK